MIDKKIVYQCISDLAEEDTTQNNINRVSLTSLHEKLMTYYPDLALASLHRELINLNNEGKIKYGGWDDAQGTPTTNDLIEIKSLFNDKAFQGNEVSLKTMSFQFSLEDCFIILDKFNSRIPVIGTDFINQHRELIEYLRDMKLFSGVPKDGGDGLAYWNKPELSGKGHILFKRLYAYLLLKAICTKQTLGSLTLNASDLSIFHFLMKAGLISYGGIQQSVKAPGGTIIAPNQITIEDAGYELLDNQSPEEIYNFFDENAKKGSSMNINNIHVNGNPMFGNGTQNNNGGVNNQVKIYYDQGANLKELTNLLEKISNNDKQMFIALVNSINDKGEYDTSKSKSLFERFPALKKGFNTIIDIVTQYGVSAGIAYIKSKFPVIF